MVTWTDNRPASGQTLSNDQPVIENNFTYLASDIGVDHNFTKNTGNSSDGYHTVIHYVQQSMDPSNIATVGQLYTKQASLGGHSDQGLFFLTGGNRLTQLTSVVQPQATSSGSISYLPGGLILICGSFSQTTDPFPFSFPNVNSQIWGPGFPTNCFGVILTPSGSSGYSTSANWRVDTIGQLSFNLTTTGVTTPFTWSYMAFGN